MQNVEFIAIVGNLGKTNLANVLCKIDIVRVVTDEDECDASPIIKEPTYFTIPSLGAGKLQQFIAKLMLKNAGSYALRLDHPCTKDEFWESTGCADKAVMWPWTGLKYVSIGVTDHDIYNLEMRYR